MAESLRVVELFDDAVWWSPDGLLVGDEVMGYLEEKSYEYCPYYISCHGGPKDLPGKVRTGHL